MKSSVHCVSLISTILISTHITRMITSTSLLRKRTSGTARPVLSVESGDGRQILQQEKKLSQRSTTIENADFVFKLCASIVFIFSIFYVGISFIGVGNSHYSHQILAYTAPFLILAAVVGVCAPILILLTSSKQLTPYERMKVNKNILKKLKRKIPTPLPTAGSVVRAECLMHLFALTTNTRTKGSCRSRVQTKVVACTTTSSATMFRVIYLLL